MNYLEFLKSPPAILEGTITCNGKQKDGYFKPLWNHWSNSLCYQYFTPKGRKGTGGFTLQRAYNLFTNNQLTVPEQQTSINKPQKLKT